MTTTHKTTKHLPKNITNTPTKHLLMRLQNITDKTTKHY